MEIIKSEERSANGPWFLNKINNRFDYHLFRQDWSSSESVLFNKDEINEVLDKIEEGEILIHRNYSILFCRTADLLAQVEDYFGCYTTLINDD